MVIGLARMLALASGEVVPLLRGRRGVRLRFLRCPLPTCSTRRILCLFPAYAPSFGTFSHAYPLFRRVRAFMPPQGLLLIVAYMPAHWPVAFA